MYRCSFGVFGEFVKEAVIGGEAVFTGSPFGIES